MTVSGWVIAGDGTRGTPHAWSRCASSLTQIRGSPDRRRWRARARARATRSASGCTTPVGQPGWLSTMPAVAGPIAASMAATSRRPSRSRGTDTGTAPRVRKKRGWSIQQGTGTMTSSPGANSTWNATARAAVAPGVTATSAGPKAMPTPRARPAAIRRRTIAVPPNGVYWTRSGSMPTATSRSTSSPRSSRWRTGLGNDRSMTRRPWRRIVRRWRAVNSSSGRQSSSRPAAKVTAPPPPARGGRPCGPG